MKNICTRIDEKVSQGFEWARREFVKRHRIDLLAPKVGCTYKTLLDRLNPDNDYHKLSGELIQMLTELTGDSILIEGLANDAALSLYRPPTEQVTEQNVINLVLRRQKLDGHFAGLLEKALDDWEINPLEAAELLPAAEDLLGVITKLIANLKQLKQGVA